MQNSVMLEGRGGGGGKLGAQFDSFRNGFLNKFIKFLFLWANTPGVSNKCVPGLSLRMGGWENFPQQL